MSTARALQQVKLAVAESTVQRSDEPVYYSTSTYEILSIT